VSKVLVIVPFAFDPEGGGMENREAQLNDVALGPDISFDFRGVKAGPALFDSYHDWALADVALFEAGKTAQVAITLAGPTQVRGRLVDAAGAPVPNTPVLAITARASDDDHGSYSYEGTPPTSGADGRFDFEVEAGNYELIVLGGPSSPVTPNRRFTAQSGQTVDLGDVTVGAPAPPP